MHAYAFFLYIILKLTRPYTLGGFPWAELIKKTRSFLRPTRA